jgi:hypothetical protein
MRTRAYTHIGGLLSTTDERLARLLSELDTMKQELHELQSSLGAIVERLQHASKLLEDLRSDDGSEAPEAKRSSWDERGRRGGLRNRRYPAL